MYYLHKNIRAEEIIGDPSKILSLLTAEKPAQKDYIR